MKAKRNQQRGQTLVIVALGLVALVAFVALAVDVGHLYGERRHMQNAADAGALAGAREICFGDPALAEQRAVEYATVQNRAEQAGVSFSADGFQITVAVTETAPTFFAGVIGFHEADVHAVAAAACGRARSGSGLWPIAFEYTEFARLYKNGDGCGDKFYVWTDDTEIDCTVYDCDIDNDGRDDVISGGDRGWLDFSAPVRPFTDDCVQPGCGESELGCQILSDSGSYIQLPTCIPGIAGIKAGVKNEVNARIDATVRIPLYTSLGCTVASGQALCDSGKGPTYWVTAFGCVKVIGWIQSFDLCMPDGSCLKNSKVIQVSIDCFGCETAIGGTDGTPAQPWEMRAVSLIR